jgi:hypothetical protein
MRMVADAEQLPNQRAGIKVIAAFLACLAGCTGEPVPGASDVTWSVERSSKANEYQFTGKATLNGGLSGWYQPSAVLVDNRGCRSEIAFRAVQIAGRDGSKNATFNERSKVKRPVATAEFRIAYMEAPGMSLDPSTIAQTTVYSDSQVVDAGIKVPSVPDAVCKTKRRDKADLRERARTDPVGADAAAIDNMSREELLATAINSAQYLCARVTDMYPSGDSIIVHCVEYRNGRGRVKYRVDADSGTVEKLS